MGVGVGKYEVVLGCYVPVGAGFRYKNPGQVVTLSEKEAAKLSDYLEPVEQDAEGSTSLGVAKRNTEEAAEPADPAERPAEDGVAERNTTFRRPDVKHEDAVQEEAAQEVTADASDSQASDERVEAGAD